jgi:hypothetical protein
MPFKVSLILKLNQFVDFFFTLQHLHCNTLIFVEFGFRSSFQYLGAFCCDDWGYISGRGSHCPSRPPLTPLGTGALVFVG